jgi:hypothetical protein
MPWEDCPDFYEDDAENILLYSKTVFDSIQRTLRALFSSTIYMFRLLLFRMGRDCVYREGAEAT